MKTFYTGIPKLFTLFDFISQNVELKWCDAKSTRKPRSKFIQSNLNKKGPACMMTKHEEFLIKLMKIRFGILDEYKQFKVSCKLISQICST